VAQGTPWRGRNGVWFEPRGLLHDGSQIAFLYPGFEPAFEPRLDDVITHFGLQSLAGPLVRPPRPEMSPIEHQACSILAVGRVLDHTLDRLGITAGMVAGHSIGEWSATIAAGAIDGGKIGPLFGAFRPGVIELPDTVFLALGCGVDRAGHLVARLPNTVISHDNCTHQSVVCGPPAEIAAVADRCRAERVLAQEMPFRSGFHSPSFGPHMGALGDALGALPLQPAHIPLWSAATCQPYPPGADAILAVAVRHLVSPVRFRELTLALHDAGARVFVQVGTGSLTGFVDDTLADREAVTVTANSAKRSGLAQLCQVAAAVWVEGGPVDMDALADSPVTTAVDPAAASRPATARPTPPARDGATTPVRQAPLLDMSTPMIRDLTPLELSPLVEALASPAAAAAGPPAPASPAARTTAEAPVVSTSDVAQPGQDQPHQVRSGVEKVLRLGLDTEPAWADHAFFRQRDGWPYSEDRFPLVPMTGIVEILQQTANELHPHLVPVTVEQVTAFRWVAVDPAVEVLARATTVSSELTDPPGSVRVRTSLEGHARATVVLAPRYPAAPVTPPPDLVDEQAPRLDAERFYIDRHMFHGPAYQGIRKFRSWAANGARGVLESLPAPGALLDAAGQVLGSWLMAQPELGQLMFPTSVARFELYGPVPAPGTLVDCTVTVTHADERGVEADIVVVSADQRTWCRIVGWKCRFFGGDTSVLEAVKWPERTAISDERPGYTLLDERWPDSASRELVMRRYLSRPERAEYERHHPLGQRAFLMARIALKDAVRRWLWALDRGPHYPGEILVATDAAGRPLVRGPFPDDLRVDVAQVEGRTVAVVAQGHDVGIDLEQVEPRLPTFEDLVLTGHEQQLAPPEGYDRDAWLTCVWAVKEAAAKAAGHGVGGRPKDVEIAEVHGTTARVGDRLVAFERLPGPAGPDIDRPQRSQKEHIVAWTVSDH
jgi:phosphopantetheinyl transferase (holo-ACP synthase)